MDNNTKHHLKIYGNVKKRALQLFQKNDLEKSLDYAYACANLAWHFHLGIWFDDDIERLLQNIGSNINKKSEHRNPVYVPKEKINSKILYIASFLCDHGGHSEALKQWVSLLKNDVSEQKVLVTNASPYKSKFPDIEKFLQDTGCKLEQFSQNRQYIDKINDMIAYIKNERPDYIILFINPSDVVSIAAIAALPIRPKIIFFNHADHAFWLGRSIIDTLIDFRQEGAKYSRQYRMLSGSHLVPLMTNIEISKVKKRMFNIPGKSTISISIGGFHKISKSYFNVIEEILKKAPYHYHVFITSPPNKLVLDSFLPHDNKIRQRLIVYGPISDLAPIYSSADFLIETFPIIGATVRSEAIKCKLPIVAYHNAQFPLFSDDDVLPPNYAFISSDEEEIIRHSMKLITDEKIRKDAGKMLYDYHENNFSSSKIHNCLVDAIFNKNNVKSKCFIPANYQGHISYDIAYLRTWGRVEKYSLFKELLNSLFLKDNSFGFINMLTIYLKAVCNREFNSFQSSKEYIKLILIHKAPFFYKMLKNVRLGNTAPLFR